jgi:hypothetical protein
METKRENRESTATGRNAPHRRLKVSFVLGLAAVLNLVSPIKSLASDTDSSLAVTVLIFNFRGVPDKTIVKAEKEAGRILQKAGVHVIWRDCPTGDEHCRKGPGRVFFLAMMAGPVQNKFLDTISGYALLSDHLAAVYYDYLPRMPGGESNKNDTALVLGCVIAHELGHLLLGPRGHSMGGIMQAHWGIEQMRRALMSQLSFLPEEARLMHADTVASAAKDNSSSAPHSGIRSLLNCSR